MDIWFALGGMCGTFLRQLATPDRPTWTRQTVVDVVVGGGSALLVGAFGLLPEDIHEVLNTPLRVVVASGVATYMGVDFLRTVIERFVPKVNKVV